MKTKLLTALTLATASFANAATVIPTTNFEAGLGVWTTNSIANTGLYVATTSLQPSSQPTQNFATSGTQAVSLGQSGGAMLSPTFDLSSGGMSETLTVNLNFQMLNGSTTRRAHVELSLDGGTNWLSLATIQVATGVNNLTSYFGTVTITEGSSTRDTSGGSFLTINTASDTPAYNGAAFTNDMVLRVRNNGSAGGDGYRVYIDDIGIESSVVIPEPSSALLGALGILLLFRRKK